MATYKSHFSSIQAWFDHASNTHYSGDVSQEFTGYATHRDMVNYCNDNTPLDKDFHKCLNALNMDDFELDSDYASVEQTSLGYAEEGFMYNALLDHAGEDNCMLAEVTIEQPKPIIWLACSFGGVYDVEYERFRSRGVAFIKAVEQLEQRGYSVGIIAYSHCSSTSFKRGYDMHLQTIIVKHPHDAYNASVAANILATPTALRTTGFKVRIADVGSEHASTTTAENSDFEHLSEVDTDNLVTFGTSTDLAEFKNPRKAVETLLQIIDKANKNG